ncbi:hypothetical protein Niako_6366 [Niastella koreensis GR20-10]|uniref:Uncharacterized protein n=1 Tax=Niastella koreensis (strain DSM 17620 / KACC 11465 / NBRC 106392 / GR20-10) TaxID=700598 RepID=G8TDV6_NIAKG|nr:hypothetical protein Niako_6366 [Niastella koreensis GR20-10]
MLIIKLVEKPLPITQLIFDKNVACYGQFNIPLVFF